MTRGEGIPKWEVIILRDIDSQHPKGIARCTDRCHSCDVDGGQPFPLYLPRSVHHCHSCPYRDHKSLRGRLSAGEAV